MAAPIIPWQPSNIASEIQKELNRRKTNRSFNYIKNQEANWDKDAGDWKTYKGPMTSWIRVCSNGAGKVDAEGHPIKPRFVLHGGKGFYETYGFSSNGSGATNQQIIGFTPEGAPHTIENNLVGVGASNYPINVPTPEIARVEVTVQQELYRRVNIEWVCFSSKQLEYMTPYFLVPGITVMIEWGWNHFNPTSLVPLYDINKMQEFWKNSYPLYTNNILRSNGNYDVTYGIVSNFNWSIEGNKIVCSTEVTSKDRLYAGIVKDSSLTVRTDDDDQPDGIFQSIKDFLSADDTIQNMKTIAASKLPLQEVTNISNKNKFNKIWAEIYKPLLTNSSPEVFLMKNPYVHGVFSGRSKDQYEAIGSPDKHDFDYGSVGNNGDKLWVNFGLVVEILNYFSALPGGGNKPIFSVDIMNSVIGGHPNLISCDARVLIPNYQAPKYHVGQIGESNFSNKDEKLPTNFGSSVIQSVQTDDEIAGVTREESDYKNQFTQSISTDGSIANQRLGKLFYQGKKKCYRNDLDVIINRYRYENRAIQRVLPQSKSSKTILTSWSFPSKEDVNDKPLPDSPNGLSGNYLEKDRSGLLSNVYISFSAFKDVILSQNTKAATYTDIYTQLLKILMDSTDGFWDLALVESDQTMTIVDRRYIGAKPISVQGDPVFSFDYFDADSLMKGLKFRPTLSDAQAARVMFGETNNQNSKYTSFDKNDLLNYKFRDAVIFNDKEKKQGDSASDLAKRSAESAKEQVKNLLSKVQRINVSGDRGLQMTIPRAVGTKSVTVFNNGGGLSGTVNNVTQNITKNEVLKLILPDTQLLRMMLDDKDEVNNSRYCAVQPGIVLELTILGIGGMRTFQYFLVKNLPEPYSEKNIIFRITDVHHTLETGNWETVIRAQPLPLRKYITSRLSGPWTAKTT
jgi:hypothetical protein